VSAADAEPAVETVTRDRIASTEALIRRWVRTTPVVRVDRADFGLPPGQLILKLEQLQHTGSFKARGAFANLLLRAVPAAGVVAASGGNHGVAVAYAARALGVQATVFVPEVSSPAKIARIRDYGADLVVTGQTYGEALVASREWSATSGALEIHAFDRAETILGAGTLAIELQQQAPDVTVVAAAVGGGGLLAGIAAGYAGSVRILGAEPEAAPTLTRALAAGRPVDSPTGSIAVDSLAPPRIGELPLSVLATYLDEVVLVSDNDIRRTQRLLWDRLRVVAEPGGCAALAALVSGRASVAVGEVPAVVISGANTTAVSFDAA
jgi:threonine dehydratase